MHDDKSFHARKCPGSRTIGVFTAGQLSKECPSMTSVRKKTSSEIFRSAPGRPARSSRWKSDTMRE